MKTYTYSPYSTLSTSGAADYTLFHGIILAHRNRPVAHYARSAHLALPSPTTGWSLSFYVYCRHAYCCFPHTKLYGYPCNRCIYGAAHERQTFGAPSPPAQCTINAVRALTSHTVSCSRTQPRFAAAAAHLIPNTTVDALQRNILCGLTNCPPRPHF